MVVLYVGEGSEKEQCHLLDSRSCNPHSFLQQEVLRLSFPVLEPWVGWSVSLPSCSSRFFCKQMWDHQPPPHLPQPSSHSLAMYSLAPAAFLHPSYKSGWMFLSSLVVGLPYSSIFCSSGCFLFLNWLLPFFWLCKDEKYTYLCLHLGWKSSRAFFILFPSSISPNISILLVVTLKILICILNKFYGYPNLFFFLNNIRALSNFNWSLPPILYCLTVF